MKIQPTLQLESHPSIWAVGDILDFPEGKRATKATGHFSVLIPNLLAFLQDKNAILTKKYTPSPENIVLTNGAVRLVSFLSLRRLFLIFFRAYREEGSDTSVSYGV